MRVSRVKIWETGEFRVISRVKTDVYIYIVELYVFKTKDIIGNLLITKLFAIFVKKMVISRV